MMKVTVPPNCIPGQELHVKTPDGRLISAVIPQGCGPGTEFLIRDNKQGTAVANELQQPKKYKRCSEEMLLLHNKGLVKITVPHTLKAGDQFKVKIPDGRTVNAVVPPGNVSEFHLKVPPGKQNWHKNSVAVTPMFVGPFL